MKDREKHCNFISDIEIIVLMSRRSTKHEKGIDHEAKAGLRQQ